MKAIIITSIFNPTIAVKKLSNLKDYSTIVVGDKKTPQDFQCDNVDYLSIERQFEFNSEFAGLLPFNHYSRKNIGYLFAFKHDAETIVDIDDDNIPYDFWAFPEFDGNYDTLSGFKGFFNIYSLFTEQKIWPRGYPLNLINQASPEYELKNGIVKIGVWQGLADEDPDVDAIYRLTINQDCFFNERKPIVLADNIVCPYNSQNSSTRKELFPLLYLPSYVTFRYTDILRGLIAQPIMWLYNFKLGFTEATVVQKRNDHNYLKDFESEIPVYLTAEKVLDILMPKINSKFSIGENLYISYETLVKEKIVGQEELKIVKIWLNELGY